MVTTDPIDELEAQSLRPHWGFAKRVSFRFIVVYFGLYCLTTQIFGGLLNIPNIDIPDLATFWPVRPILLWAASHIFRIQQPLVYTGSGSGDKIFDWLLVALLLVIAALATVVWSVVDRVIDRRRTNYDRAFRWFQLFLRFALGSQMLSYGFAKVFPMQMPYPGLRTLVEPFGSFSPMGVLWTFIGASPAYEILCGSAELLGGILVMLPRTSLLGALVCAGVTGQIFVLNMTYDVPVKLLSFQLMLMSLFLAAPEFSRLATLFFRDRPVEPSKQRPLFRGRRGNQIALAAQLVFLAWLLGTDIYGGFGDWKKYGGASPKPVLYGIWKIDKVSIDGHERSPLLNDYGRWRQLIFEYPGYMNYQRMDESFGSYGAVVNEKDQSITLADNSDKKWRGSLHYQRPAQDRLILDGNLGGHPVAMQLELVDKNKFLLISRGFHWVQEYPFHR